MGDGRWMVGRIFRSVHWQVREYRNEAVCILDIGRSCYVDETLTKRNLMTDTDSHIRKANSRDRGIDQARQLSLTSTTIINNQVTNNINPQLLSSASTEYRQSTAPPLRLIFNETLEIIVFFQGSCLCTSGRRRDCCANGD